MMKFRMALPISIAATMMSGGAYASDPYKAASDMFKSNIEAMAVFKMCGDTIGLPALYETYRIAAVNDLVLAGKTRSEAILIVGDIERELANVTAITDKFVCQTITTDAAKALDVNRAKFKMAAGLN